MTSIKPHIKSFTLEELENRFREMGEPAFRAAQVFDWIFSKSAVSFDTMTNLSKKLRDRLSAEFEVTAVRTVRDEKSIDGTQKLQLALRDGHTIECVIIPDDDRVTLCVSSQVGCPLKCSFCVTGSLGFVRNLDSGEIVDQVIEVMRRLPSTRRITNIVFMGMGEPFLNFPEVARALRTITSPTGLGFSRRRITVSTSGIADRISDFAALNLGDLAVSLNAPDNETRTSIMPVNKKYPLDRLIPACRQYTQTSGRRVTFEYVMLAGINDSPAHAEALGRLIGAIPCKINLIPLNDAADRGQLAPQSSVVGKFFDILRSRELDVFLRQSRGSDISAACGQLGGIVIGPQEKEQD